MSELSWDGRPLPLRLSRPVLRAFAVSLVVGADVVGVALGCVIGSFLRFGDLSGGHSVELSLALIPSYLVGVLATGGYTLRTIQEELRSVGQAVTSLSIAVGLLIAAAFAMKVTGEVSRLELGAAFLSATVCLTAVRSAVARALPMFRSITRRTAIVVSDHADRDVTEADAVLTPFRPRASEAANDPEFLHDVCERVASFDRVIIAISDEQMRKAWIAAMRMTGLDAEVVDQYISSHLAIGIGEWDGKLTLQISRGPLSILERGLKRILDLVLVMAVLPLAVPLLAVCGLLIWIETGDSPIFLQARVGRGNRQYNCYKLRTMRAVASTPWSSESTARGDARITRIGRLLRRTSLDEVPQLWNVLLGDMSLVGPRPHALGSTAEGARFWEVVDSYWQRHSVKPGITGLAQVRGLRGTTETKQDLQDRFSADLEYINRWSIWLDISILFRTLGVVVHRNAF